jgi:hypothetical protein
MYSTYAMAEKSYRWSTHIVMIYDSQLEDIYNINLLVTLLNEMDISNR